MIKLLFLKKMKKLYLNSKENIIKSLGMENTSGKRLSMEEQKKTEIKRKLIEQTVPFAVDCCCLNGWWMLALAIGRNFFPRLFWFPVARWKIQTATDQKTFLSHNFLRLYFQTRNGRRTWRPRSKALRWWTTKTSTSLTSILTSTSSEAGKLSLKLFTFQFSQLSLSKLLN